MSPKPLVVIGMLGSTLDNGRAAKRWKKWRPTVAMCSHNDLLVSRLELLYQEQFQSLCNTVVEDIAHVSPETKVLCHPIEFEDPWDLENVYETLHCFAKSYVFTPNKEDYLIHITTGTHIVQISSFLLTEARYYPGRILQMSPPGSKNKGGPGTFKIIDLDLSKYDRIAQRFKQEAEEGLSFLKSGIETKNTKFNVLIGQIEKVAIASKDPIFLSGPTGAGKSHLAKRIYALKKSRAQVVGDFVDVNCATIRGDAAMSALFGHCKGAFTGAIRKRLGHLMQADHGMLFLDEIGELGLEEQAMMLRAIEEKVFFAVGSDKKSKSNFQLIVGTNRDLQRSVREGTFREDLLARINLWTYDLPGLKERPEDIEPNFLYELEHCGRQLNLNITISLEAKEKFLAFACDSDALWTGNFRDLNGAVRRMATLCEGGRIGVKDVDGEVERLRTKWKGAHNKDTGFGEEIIEYYLGKGNVHLDRFDILQLADVLKVCEQSRSMAHAGKQLYAISRTQKKTFNDSDRIRKYLARFGLSWKDIHPATERA